MRRLVFFALCACFAINSQAAQRPPQFVHLAFDGSKSLTMWNLTRDFARETENVRFTYFISGVYFLSNSHKRNYVEPNRGAGRSAIGFGGKSTDIQSRVDQLRLAVEEGHEIASHANGHYNGSKYSENQWNNELSQFTSIMTDSWGKYSKNAEPTWWRDLFQNKVTGFRAPQLGKSRGMWPALVKNGYAYDTSRIDKMSYWPKIRDGVWNFPLASVRIVGSGVKTISMDYNFYFAQSKAKKAAASQHKKFENQMFDTYMAYFRNNYNGNRAPMHIGHHFSRWNGGAYWNALKRFAVAVCNQPEVICGTYQELVEFLESSSPETLAAYRKGDFPKSDRVATGPATIQLANFGQQDIDVTDAELEELRLQSHDHVKAHEDNATIEIFEDI